jgi:hypothetical protein
MAKAVSVNIKSSRRQAGSGRAAASQALGLPVPHVDPHGVATGEGSGSDEDASPALPSIHASQLRDGRGWSGKAASTAQEIVDYELSSRQPQEAVADLGTPKSTVKNQAAIRNLGINSCYLTTPQRLYGCERRRGNFLEQGSPAASYSKKPKAYHRVKVKQTTTAESLVTEKMLAQYVDLDDEKAEKENDDDGPVQGR